MNAIEKHKIFNITTKKYDKYIGVFTSDQNGITDLFPIGNNQRYPDKSMKQYFKTLDIRLQRTGIPQKGKT